MFNAQHMTRKHTTKLWDRTKRSVEAETTTSTVDGVGIEMLWCGHVAQKRQVKTDCAFSVEWEVGGRVCSGIIATRQKLRIHAAHHCRRAAQRSHPPWRLLHNRNYGNDLPDSVSGLRMLSKSFYWSRLRNQRTRRQHGPAWVWPCSSQDKAWRFWRPLTTLAL